jgi:SAM-dependent methyltransferase
MLEKIEHHRVNQKYKGYIQPNNQDVFEILHKRIESLVPNCYDKTILDFGCNVGHLLKTAGNKISHKKYYGVDISQKSLDIAAERFPDANWIHYDGYNPTFNPDGKEDAIFELPIKPDIIIAYGVFTHCTFNETRKWIDYFRTILNTDGAIVFSIWEDTDFKPYLQFLNLAFGIKKNLDPICEKSIYFVNRDHVIIDQPDIDQKQCDWFESFFKRSHILDSIKDSRFLPGIYTHHQVYGIK